MWPSAVASLKQAEDSLRSGTFFERGRNAVMKDCGSTGPTYIIFLERILYFVRMADWPNNFIRYSYSGLAYNKL